MKKHTNILVLSVILVLFIVPVLIAQIAQPERRHLRGVALEDTHYTEINFQNSVQQIELGGMLFVPSGGGAFPAVVVIHGSGTSMRSNRWYLTLTQYLQENGYRQVKWPILINSAHEYLQAPSIPACDN